MAKLYRRLRRPLETGGARLAMAIIPRLPRTVLLVLARFGGLMGYHLDTRGRRIGLANLDLAFGDRKSLPEKRSILRKTFTTFSRTFLDVIWFSRNSEHRLEKYVHLDSSINPLLCHKNQVCITAHFGNWEAMGQKMAQAGYPIHSIAMPVKNPAVDRLLIERREVTGQKIIPRTGALRKLLSVLRNNGKAAFLVDQNTEEKEGGIWGNFFGLPVPVTPAPATMAAKTGSEIFIGFCAPMPGGHYRVYITETIQPTDDTGKEATRELTQQILSTIEREVTKYPEYWLWMYKRWEKIYRPEDSGRYPFYAKY